MKNFSFFVIVFCMISMHLYAQELNCKVVVNSERIQTQDRQVFSDMEQAFTRFLNEYKWTNDVFSPEERINSNLVISIESMPSIGTFTASVQIQSSRPVYNTNFESLILNFADRDWQFEYIESTPLDYNDNVFTTNITAMLAFYAYTIIGLDYDTFSSLGGDPYFQKALNIVNLAQSFNYSGWKSLEGNRNRYWLITNIMDQQFRPIREGLYTYHRLALDVFTEKPDDARKEVLEVLKNIQKANRLSPNSILKIAFFDAKKDELINIFSKGDPKTRRDAYNILVNIDPKNTESYKSITEN